MFCDRTACRCEMKGEILLFRRRSSDCVEFAIGCEPSIWRSSVPTGNHNQKANDPFEQFLTFQNAAKLQWPERDSANITVRTEFKLDSFPSKVDTADKEQEPDAGEQTV